MDKRRGGSNSGNLSKNILAKSAYTSTSSSSPSSSSSSESEIEELSSKLPKHGVPYKIQSMQKNEVESEDGGGGWHQHVGIRQRTPSGNLSKSTLSKKAYTSSSSSSGSSDYSSEDEIIPEMSSKLPKHGVPYNIQSMQKNEVESEDGGGGWHQHVGVRNRTPSGNLSRNNLSKKAYTSSSSSSSSSDQEEKSVKLIKHVAPYDIQQIKNDGVESEDGGGGWHQHVSKRGRNISGNLSKSRIEAEHSSDDEKSPLLEQTIDSGNFSMSHFDNTLNGSSKIGKQKTQVCIQYILCIHMIER